MAVMTPKLQAVAKRIEEFEPIARSRTGVLTFSLVTSESLQTVLRPTFLDRFSTSGLRKFDRIEVNADCLGAGERAMLLVEENLEGKVKVRQLWQTGPLPLVNSSRGQCWCEFELSFESGFREAREWLRH